nr:MAG TPA: hypothetical protein [Caudoviricetes sp.]
MKQSKRDLINKLCKIYPYGTAWFEKLSEPALYAMLKSYKPKKTNVAEPKKKIIAGEEFIKTDSGAWEPVID